MEINIIRLRSLVSKNDKRIIKEGNDFLDNLNTLLTSDDVLLTEGDYDESKLNMIFVESGGTETIFEKEIFKKHKGPYYLLSSSKNNSLAASFEIKTYCLNKNEKALLISGSDENIVTVISSIASVYEVYKETKGVRLGVFGKPSDWLIASKVDYKEVKDLFGIELVDIPMKELEEEIDKNIKTEIRKEKDFRQKFKDQKVLDEAINIYSSIKRLVKKYDLKGLTIRCFDLLKRYKNTACLALGLLNDEGIVSACEGDVPSLLSMYFLNKVSSLPVFMCNPSRINYEDGTMLLAHCSIPFKLCSSYSLDTHFESDLGVAIKGNMRSGKITICKVFPSLDNMIVESSSIIKATSEKNCCRSQIVVEINEDCLKDLTATPFGNHLVLTYGEFSFELLSLFGLFMQNRERKHNK